MIRYSTAEREIEAESVAFVVSSHFGLQELASPNYLALWDADEEKILTRMERLSKQYNQPYN